MNCEKCGGKSHVRNSRGSFNGVHDGDIPKKYNTGKSLTYRSNKCNDCGFEFKSIEMTRGSFDEFKQEVKQVLLLEIENVLKG